MAEVRVHFQTTTYWTADIDWDQFQELAAERQYADDGNFRCPSIEDVQAVASYEVSEAQEPCTTLAEMLNAQAVEQDGTPIAITELVAFSRNKLRRQGKMKI